MSSFNSYLDLDIHIQEYYKWIWDIESTISQSIADCVRREWNEDHITYTWLKEIRKKGLSIKIQNWSRPFSITWDGFKADGSLEESNGDVAIIVKQTFPNRKELLGVAFLEAKRTYKESGSYEKIDWSQLNRHITSSSVHKLLLYDHKPATPNYHIDFAYYFEKYGHDLSTHACVCPSTHAIAYRTRTRKLHELCVPLSHQICLRYFFGHDLDYNPKLVSDVLNGVADGVDYLIVAHVSYHENGKSSVNTIGFNRDAYIQEDNESEQ